MLPEVLAGSYSRYKEDTNVFTTWLSKAAIACGYRAPKIQRQDKIEPPKQQSQGSASRLKSKARKEAKALPKLAKALEQIPSQPFL